ncbi:MAG: hypothetical protein WBF42_11075, partial [Terracidiphilus sp.]
PEQKKAAQRGYISHANCIPPNISSTQSVVRFCERWLFCAATYTNEERTLAQQDRLAIASTPPLKG